MERLSYCRHPWKRNGHEMKNLDNAMLSMKIRMPHIFILWMKRTYSVEVLDNWIEKEVQVIGRENLEQIKTQLLAIEASLQRFSEPTFSMVIPLTAGAIKLLLKFENLVKFIAFYCFGSYPIQ